MKFYPHIIAPLFAALSASAAWGQAPARITYQGELTEGECLAEGVYDMEISIWSHIEEGTEIMRESIPGVEVSNGRFSILIPVENSTFTSTFRFLELTVNGVTLSPRERITAAPYSMQTRGVYVDELENVGIGLFSPEERLDVWGNTKLRGDASVRDVLSVGDPELSWGQLSIVDSGDGRAFAISADWDNDDTPTVLATNAGQGGVLWAIGPSDAAPGGGGLIVAGDQGSQNIAIDANEIMARDGGETSTLYLNHNGGDVVVGGSVDMGWTFFHVDFNDQTYGEAICPEGMLPLSGGCNALAGIEAIASSHPTCDENGCGWSCSMESGDGIRVYVVCAKIK